MQVKRRRVLIVDDHPAFSEGFKVLLEAVDPNFQVVGIADTTEEALQLVTEHSPDLVLMDVRMTEPREGLDATEQILKARPDIRIVLCTASFDSEAVSRAMSAGARGFVLKKLDPKRILWALDLAAEGYVVLPQEAIKSVSWGVPENTLNDDERRILVMAAEGMDNNGIAKELAISESTLKRHILKVQEKLGVENRAQAIVHAAREGWI